MAIPNIFHESKVHTQNTSTGAAMTIEQHIRFGEIALAALITQHDSIVITPTELASKAWELADAMTNIYIVQNGNR